MHRPKLILAAALMLTTGMTASALAAAPISSDQLEGLQKLIRPQGDEAQWATVPWMPATNIWDARRKAAQQDKPILLWYMAGEPLGTC